MGEFVENYVFTIGGVTIVVADLCPAEYDGAVMPGFAEEYLSSLGYYSTWKEVFSFDDECGGVY